MVAEPLLGPQEDPLEEQVLEEVGLEVGQALQVPMEAHEAVPLVQEELLLPTDVDP